GGIAAQVTGPNEADNEVPGPPLADGATSSARRIPDRKSKTFLFKSDITPRISHLLEYSQPQSLDAPLSLHGDESLGAFVRFAFESVADESPPAHATTA